MAIFSAGAISRMLSGIEMATFDLLPTGPASGNPYGALHQSRHQLAFIFSGAPHVSLGIGGSARSFSGCGNRLVVRVAAQDFTAQFSFRPGRTDRRQSNAAKSNRGMLADVARHRELYRSARARIHGSAPLERQISAPAVRVRDIHFNI